MMDYSKIFQLKQHTITIRSRNGDYPVQKKNWNNSVFDKCIDEQDDNSDIYITKYPQNRLISYIILDFDSEEDIKTAETDAVKLFNKLTVEGHNCVLVDSGNKGYHLYIQIAPVLFANSEKEQRGIKDWNKFFNEFVHCLLFSSVYSETNLKYPCLDKINTSAGLGGNIRLIGSKHPVSHKTCKIIKGSFKDFQGPTHKQDSALRYAYHKCEIVELSKKRAMQKLKLVNCIDPVSKNDLREVFPAIFSEDVTVYDKGYAYMKCPFHDDNRPSLLITKEWFSCSACGEKGNIWTLKKKGYVEFDGNGGVI